jgi:hypothetical protein
MQNVLWQLALALGGTAEARLARLGRHVQIVVGPARRTTSVGHIGDDDVLRVSAPAFGPSECLVVATGQE